MFDTLDTYFKTDTRYFFHGSFWLTLGSIANTLLSLALVYAFGNYVTPEIYGTYRYLLSVYGILSLGSFAGFNSAVARSVAQGNEGDFIRGFRIQCFGSLIATAIAAVIAGWYALQGNAHLAQSFLILGLALPLMESLDLYNAYLNGKKLFKMITIVSFVTQACATLALIAAIFLHASLLPLLLTYFLSWIAIKFFFFSYVRHAYPPNASCDPRLASIGFHLTFVDFLNDAASYLDRVLLFHFMGAKEVAVYSLAIAGPDQSKSIFNNIKVLVSPKFSTRSEREMRATMMHKTLVLAGGIIALIILYVLAAPLLVRTFLPRYYPDIVSLSQVYAISLLGAVSLLPLAALNAIPKIKPLYFINILTPLVSIALIVLLIPLYGVWGAILARVIGRLTGALFMYAGFSLS